MKRRERGYERVSESKAGVRGEVAFFVPIIFCIKLGVKGLGLGVTNMLLQVMWLLYN